MMPFTAEVAITSWWPSPMGGGVAIGTVHGDLVKAAVPSATICRYPVPGETWRITGRRSGDRVEVDIALPMLPSGAAIQRWMARNPSLPGVGRATAARIWDRHKSDLYRILGEGDATLLSQTVSAATARTITNAFQLLQNEVGVLEAYDRVGVSASTAIAACRLWGEKAVERLKADPYCITVLDAWEDVDKRALRIGVTLDDPRRLIACVAEVMARRYRTREREISGHTAATRAEVERAVSDLLGDGITSAKTAFALALDAGELLPVDGLFQGRAPYRMERDVEATVRARLSRGRKLNRAILAASFIKVYQETGVNLSQEQRDAVSTALGAGFAVIDGAAGTGKSTVTRAIRHYTELAGSSYHQMALSGRAAKRLAEATGAKAMTVHSFLRGMAYGKMRLAGGLVLVDEVSMLGLPDLWQIVSWLPPETDVILIGDPGQLPAINAGNPLQAFVDSSSVPRRTLTVIRRQAIDSEIPQVAGEMRQGTLPNLLRYDQDDVETEGVQLLSCPTDQVARRVLEVFERLVGPPAKAPDWNAIRQLHGARVQILGANKRGPAGVLTISDAIECRWMAAQSPVHDWGVGAGSKILWTKNSYDHQVGRQDEDGNEVLADIMNGALGIIQRETKDGAIVIFDDVDSTKAEIRRSDLEHVSRGWAVTVHKAQGSAFDTVIMPITPGRLLDRLLIYTAITRARRRAILIGDRGLLRQAVESEPRSHTRRQCLNFDRHLYCSV